MKTIFSCFLVCFFSVFSCFALDDLTTQSVLVTNYDGNPVALFKESDDSGLAYLQYDNASKSWTGNWVSLGGALNSGFVKSLSAVKNATGVLRGVIASDNSGNIAIYAYNSGLNTWQVMSHLSSIRGTNNIVFVKGLSFDKNSFGVVVVNEAVPNYTLNFYKASYNESAQNSLTIEDKTKQEFKLRGVEAKSDIQQIYPIYNKSKLEGVIVTSNTSVTASYVHYCDYSLSTRDRCERVARYNSPIEAAEIVYAGDNDIDGFIVKAGTGAHFLPYSRGELDGRHQELITLSAWDTVDDIHSVTSKDGETIGVVAVFMNGLVKYLPHSSGWKNHIWKILRNASAEDYIKQSLEFDDHDGKHYLFIGDATGRVEYLVNDDSFKATSWQLIADNEGVITKFVPFLTANGDLESVESLFLNPFSSAKIEIQS
ncbi:hypothetical protein [Francisella adeliensis]|uniref:Uncharacterized protein n=1 Tax=Francisella adeliensis TaxID=2007306 RepID=A0A2Z4Y104_9GAMM|nr:hypothetical protein [Francisella adeliensis]AXA34235.1 hypothetical protein CDH04_07385 [Francisella adeliensis]MBK2084876.1 hypothetical protein [Francisella adeliensis]MBK2096293.1 hypothetical protein [Francisella adeliensis]QIW12479.1 hypothetical protein FZC43_07390 [Francisella adeliensis]QIW14352.1 hypothetical protein FZC44_07385 [Francisella adeliensis]